MRFKQIYFILLLLIIGILPACNTSSPTKFNGVVVGISSDVESLNPLFSFTVNEGNISELLYLSPLQFQWDSSKGELIPQPMLAKSWQWSKDSSSITFYFRKNVKWTDGVPFTVKDVIFSFDVYSDPLVQSRLFGTFKSLYTDSSQHINLAKTFKVVNPYELIINFRKDAVPSLVDINIPIIPEHVFKNVDRKNLITYEKNHNSVFDGAFYLKKWNKNQSIILQANKNSFLYKPGNIDRLIFKVIPDYTSRLTQLKQGEIDLMEDIRADDVPILRNSNNLVITAIKGREYDYIGWNNLNPSIYEKSKKIVSNQFFGDYRVRTALTDAINREEILREFLDNHGEIAYGPVAPIFKSELDTTLIPRSYDPGKAKELLSQVGWRDSNNDGILDKNGKKFSFTLYIPSGNPRRQFAASIIQNNLRIVGIEVKIQSLEPEVFFGKMFDKKFNAWMAGWSVPIPLDLKPYWNSNLKENILNVAGYQNHQVNTLLNKIDVEKSKEKRNNLNKKIQDIIYKDEPFTFLYWIDNIVVYNKRIKGINVTPLGAVLHCWNWSVNK
ncbi:MAG TPA: hypothetical protein ENI61_00625 [Ignavibacteria bacterium]|nr:hypothetical protein [Ignavibacteria bacterium]